MARFTLEDRQKLDGRRRWEYVQDRTKIIAHTRRLPEVNPGRSDGEPGPRTNFAVVRLKKCMGYSAKAANERDRWGNVTIDDRFIARLYRPFDPRFYSDEMLDRGARYREKLRRDHRKRVKALQDGTLGERALRAAGLQLGHHETSNNDAPWLEQMENDLPTHALDWVIPGSPYCGFGVIWSYWKGAHVMLPQGFVYTPNIKGYSGKTIGGLHFDQIRPEDAREGDPIVFDWNPGTGADHVGLCRGPMRGGVILTREFNTSPSNAGSQGNGGGVYDRTRPRQLVQCVVRVTKA